MATCRETGTTDLTDHLATADPLARPNQIACGVVEGGFHSNSVDAAVAEEQPVAVSRTEDGPGNYSRVRRTNGCAASGGKVSAIVQFPDLQHWMESHPEGGRHRTSHRVKKPVTARSASRGHDRAGLSRGRGRSRASLSFAPHDFTLRLRNQPQPAAASAEQQQRIKVTSALAESPVKAASTMPARSEYADHLPPRHPVADAYGADHRLVRSAD